MRITKAKYLYQLTFVPMAFPVNCYLVEEEDSLTLIDAALPYSWKGILKAAKQIGKPIKRIVLTHAHGDHLGSLDALKEQLPEVPVYISERDARLMKGDKSLDPTEPQEPIRGDVPSKLRTQADVLLQGGDTVGSLFTISTPGHTPGSMAFLDQRTNSIIAGDAFQTRGGIAVAGQIRPTFPFPAWGTWDKRLAVSSAEKIIEYKPELLAVGHGKMIVQPEEQIIQAVRIAEENLQHK
ncbi:glyoxylase-like metal-dependent hydrolase (beta-lactamase superfamily II) [Bacillus oleivorans]|uniref:Glyoxylase-like metal-dependent hydrolase (Beta-lactamase superfamily II) n=1 Tax=Bacillus oleivorans TaxID=1448271 RepID=A0A285CGV2_9BACI|nr:MBL fold metallo-hydrolase [Bacillus oleivorans]SNX66827.1 glyoxylase-like metal-dependent hydrolase (beta-lactamase superfamily II) [Bacillus oleivorans]